MSLRLKISTVGEPVLRQVGRELTVDEINSPSTQQLIELMRETVRDAPGVGLAAPQVGMSLQLAVIEDRPEYHQGVSEEDLAARERKPVPFHVVINPKIRLLSEPDVVFFEGCLSLPGFTAMVPRARRVAVDCLDHRGEPVRIEAQGWYARILQHEIDHLNGTLYIDRMLSGSFASVENYSRYWKDKSAKEAEKLASCRCGQG
ncbi:peptide deformylase [Paramesorhizobium deserti]|uniref:Peptide deformylase n=1 Tax=Paramesorhizobium deserti TaxID=1494590 RepID=A0A135HQA2_9HYPH|nr:peptide deformylase [Paramesorhizobium deserti]KXF75368.1 peptide deformylase [Paramesorhizobium deserti]